jgi:hypothetical protein
MAAYYQWLKGVRRRAAVRSRCWRWIEDAVARASGGRLVAITAAPTTAATPDRSRRSARRRTRRTPVSVPTGKDELH